MGTAPLRLIMLLFLLEEEEALVWNGCGFWRSQSVAATSPVTTALMKQQ